MKNKTKLSVVAVAGLVSACALVYGLTEYEQKMQSLHVNEHAAALAVQSFWVDDCGGLAPDPGVDFPILSTPIAYITAEKTLDPFGKQGDSLLFLPSRYHTNAGIFAIVSRGPDGDLDCERLPRRTDYFPAVELPEGTEFTLEDGGVGVSKGGNSAYPTFGVMSYRLPGRKTIQNQRLTMRMLPEFADGPKVLTEKEVEASASSWIKEHGVDFYDPTNGATSDGDYIFFH